MCGPVAAVIGGVVSGVGALVQASAARRSYEAQAALNDRQAGLERLRGEYEAGQFRKQADRLIGTTIASGAAGGVLYSGSVAEVVQETIAETELDIEAIKYGANVNAANYQAQAGIDRANGRRALIGGFFNAAGNVLGGFTSAVQISNGQPIFGGARTTIPAGGYTF